jgi:hypothetical protein
MVASRPVMDITLAEMLDDLCTAILAHRGTALREVHLTPRLFDLIAAARGRRADGPMLLLGLDAVRDTGVSAERFRVR